MAAPDEIGSAEFRRQLVRLLIRYGADVDTAALSNAIDGERFDEVIRLLEESWEELDPQLELLMRAGVTSATSKGFRSGMRIVTAERPSVPRRAINHAWKQAGRRVTAIGRLGRKQIRKLVTAAIAGGASNEDLQAELMRSGMALDDPRARALRAYAAELEKAVRDGEIDARAAAARLKRRGGAMLRSRAFTIAVTETADAQGYGRQAAWDDAIRRGVIKESEWRKKWRIKDDERTTDTCRVLVPEIVGVKAAFSWGGTRPPRHPRCRCACYIIRVAQPA